MIGFVVNPGLLPIVKALSMDIRGRKMLVTRRIQRRDEDKGVVAQLDHFGVRIMVLSIPFAMRPTSFGKPCTALRKGFLDQTPNSDRCGHGSEYLWGPSNHIIHGPDATRTQRHSHRDQGGSDNQPGQDSFHSEK